MRSNPTITVILLRALVALWLVSVIGCGSKPPPRTRARTSALQPLADDPPELIGVWYTVQRGDLLSAIATRHEVPLNDLIEINGIEDPNALEVGQDLFLYGVDKLVARLSKKKPSKKPGKRQPKPPPLKPSGDSSSKFAWPVKKSKSRLSSGYGPRWGKVHRGLDMAAKQGTPIYAAAAGTVIYSDNKQRGYGNLIIIQHAEQFVTVYAHNRRNLVDEGDQVRQGQRIGEVGSTGRSTGPHLHFEIRVKGKAKDPIQYLPPR